MVVAREPIMPRPSSRSNLPLPKLSVKGLRGIADLSIPRLGRVTLIAGKNGVGKTTVLEAVRIYAAGGNPVVLRSILLEREEFSAGVDDEGVEISAPDLESLFYGRHPLSDSCISINPGKKTKQLDIRIGKSPSQELFSSENSPNIHEPSLEIQFQGKNREFPIPLFGDRSRLPYRRLRGREIELPSSILCLSLGPSLPNSEDMAQFWDNVALTNDEDRAVQALRLIYGEEVDRIVVVGNDRPRYPRGRRALVKMRSQDGPVPLKSLGDGAVRLFGVALALANSQGGLLTIDEAENGIHHSVQYDFWKMVMQTAKENNVQVLATTHGWDCIAGFAQAAAEADAEESVLLRLERDGDKVRAVEYLREDLVTATEQGIEVR